MDSSRIDGQFSSARRLGSFFCVCPSFPVVFDRVGRGDFCKMGRRRASVAPT